MKAPEPTPQESEQLNEILKTPKNFKLHKGDTFKINNTKYKVTKVMSGGRAMIKEDR